MLLFALACVSPSDPRDMEDGAGPPRAPTLAPTAPEIQTPAPEVEDHPTLAGPDPLSPSGLGLTYEIYVRSYQDTDGDGIGDFPGVESRLDHIDSLGVDTLWLMPVFPARGPAGYDVEDFETLTAEYGTVEELDSLVEAAHERGIRVLLDLPFNHTSRTHPWFAEAEADPGSESRGMYRFSDTQWDPYRWFEAEGGGYYYAFFGGELPDLDWRDAEVQARMTAVWDQWLEHVDGYRLDAVRVLVETTTDITDTDETHALLADLYARTRAAHPDARLLAEASCETAEDSASYLGAAAPEADAVIDFPRREAMLAAFTDSEPDVLLALLEDSEAAGGLSGSAPYLQSHDLSRLPAYVADPAARRALEVTLLTLPGNPILYYGEELDIADATTATGQDYAWRAPMAWDRTSNGGFTTSTAWLTPDPGYLSGLNVADAEADPDSLLHLIRGASCVRSAVAGGEWQALDTSDPHVFSYSWTTATGLVVVAVNLSDGAIGETTIDVRGGFRSLTESVGVDAGEGLRFAGMEAYGYRIWSDGPGWRCEVPGPVGG